MLKPYTFHMRRNLMKGYADALNDKGRRIHSQTGYLDGIYEELYFEGLRRSLLTSKTQLLFIRASIHKIFWKRRR